MEDPPETHRNRIPFKNLNRNEKRNWRHTKHTTWDLSVRSTDNLTSQRISLLWWSSNRETSNSNQRESNRLKQKSLKKKRSEKCFNRINRLQSSLTIEHRNRGRRIDYKGEEQKSRSNETGITPVRAAVDTKEAWRGDKSRQSETEEATETQRQKPPVHRRRRRRECRSQNPAGWTEAGEPKGWSPSLSNNLYPLWSIFYR